MIDIVSVGNPKIAYQDHSNIDFEPLSFYITLAQKTIAKFAKNFSSSLAKEMLNSEDAISNVANCIMMADWRWDKERKGQTGQQKNKYSYRNQCAIWAIKSYMTRKKQKHNKAHSVDVDMNYEDDGLSLLDILPSPSKSPIQILLEKENNDDITEIVSYFLSSNSDILSDKQKECIRLYYLEGLTFAEIGKKFSITREAVRQNIKKSIQKIQSII
jgi:RNA polymerase sigma factor (sigma-70 family)